MGNIGGMTTGSTVKNGRLGGGSKDHKNTKFKKAIKNKKTLIDKLIEDSKNKELTDKETMVILKKADKEIFLLKQYIKTNKLKVRL